MNLTLQSASELETKELSVLFGWIALNYLTSTYSFCHVTSGRYDDGYIGNEFVGPSISIDIASITASVQMANMELGCQVYVLSERSAIGFLDDYRYLQDHTNQRFPNKVFIIVMENDSDYNEMQEILKRPIIQDIPKLLFISFYKEKEKINLWTNKFSSIDGHKQLLYLDTYSITARNFQNGVNLFPDKIINLDGRFIRLAMINYEPYTTWIEVDNDSEANAYIGDVKKLKVDGTETRIFLEFCKKHNCSLDISIEEEAQWGEVFENFSGTGIMGGIAEHRVDAGIGAMLAWFYESNSPTHSLSRTGVTCITPKQKLLPSWMTPILPFSILIWIALTISIITISIVMIIFNQIAVKCILNTSYSANICEVFTTVASSLVLCSSIARIEQYKLASQLMIVTLLLFCGLIVGNTYCGGLSSIMTLPQYEKPIDTPAQLAAGDIIWGASHDAWVYAFEDTDEPLIIKLVSKFRTMTKANLHKHAKRADMAYAIERLPYGHYGISDYIALDVAQNFQVMVEDLYWGHCVVQVTKTWPMKEHLNELIMRIFQSGIQRYWEERVLAQFPAAYTVQKIIGLARVHDNPGAISLQVHHLTGPIFLLLFGLLGAFLVFLVEIVFEWFSKKYRYQIQCE